MFGILWITARWVRQDFFPLEAWNQVGDSICYAMSCYIARLCYIVTLCFVILIPYVLFYITLVFLILEKFK